MEALRVFGASLSNAVEMIKAPGVPSFGGAGSCPKAVNEKAAAKQAMKNVIFTFGVTRMT